MAVPSLDFGRWALYFTFSGGVMPGVLLFQDPRDEEEGHSWGSGKGVSGDDLVAINESFISL
jgi:hypothetical protein